MNSVLNELLPRKARLVLYVIVFFALLGLTAWQAAEGNFLEALVSFLTSAAPLLAAGNLTPPEPESPPGYLPTDELPSAPVVDTTETAPVSTFEYQPDTSGTPPAPTAYDYEHGTENVARDDAPRHFGGE